MSEETKDGVAETAASETTVTQQVAATAEPQPDSAEVSSPTPETAVETAPDNDQLPPPPEEIVIPPDGEESQAAQPADTGIVLKNTNIAKLEDEPEGGDAAEPVPEETSEAPAPAQEKKGPTKKHLPSDEDVAKAVDVIKRTGVPTSICLEKELKVHWRWAIKLINELERRDLLGPKKGPFPREIKFPLNPGVEPKKPTQVAKTDKKAPKGKDAKAPAKKNVESLKIEWDKKLRTVGGFTDDGFVSAAVHYASVNHGYSINHKWGSVLITMISRLAFHLRDRIECFTLADATFIQRSIMTFLNEKPLGDSVIDWNDPEQWADNNAQRKAVLDFWALSGRRFDQLSQSEQALKMVVDSTFPSEFEAQKLVGGTFAERLHYLLFFVVKVITTYDNFEQVFWGPMLHNEPTPEYRRRSLEKRGIKVDESWIEDGKCKECGSDVVLNKHGVKVCSNSLCPKSMIVMDTRRTSDGFRSGKTTPSAQQRAPRTFDDAPRQPSGGRHDRRDRGDDGDHGFPQRKSKPKGPRHMRGEGEYGYHDNGDDGSEPAAPPRVWHAGGEMPNNNPFGDL